MTFPSTPPKEKEQEHNKRFEIVEFRDLKRMIYGS